MKTRVRVPAWLFTSAIVVSGTISSHPGYGADPNLGPASYPPTFAVLPKAKLDAIKRATEAKNPGWTVDVSPIGLLASAHFGVPSKAIPEAPLTKEDRERVRRFFVENQELVGGDIKSATLKYDRPARLFYQQLVDGTVVGFIAIDRQMGRISISGHLVPNFALPAGVTLKSDEELRSLLAGDDSAEKGQLVRGTRRQADDPAREVEIHLSACLGDGPTAKCVDAIDGRPLTRDASMTVNSSSVRGTSYSVEPDE